MNFPSATELMMIDLTTSKKMLDFANSLVAQCPINLQVRWEQAVADIGRYVSIVATGSFVNVYIDEGNRRGSRVLEISVRKDFGGDEIYHLCIARNNRVLTKKDREILYQRGYDDYGGNVFPQFKYREYKWNKMMMTDHGFMGGR